MPRSSHHKKASSFNLRIDHALKTAFTQATEAEDKPAAQVIRDLMWAYVRRRERQTFEREARHQSLQAAIRARDPRTDEYAVMRELEADLADETFWNDDLP